MKKRNQRILKLLSGTMALLCLPPVVGAQGLDVIPNSMGGGIFAGGSVPPPGPNFEIQFNLSCYRTNLRGVLYPIDAGSKIETIVNLTKADGTISPVQVQFDAAGVGGGALAPVLVNPAPSGGSPSITAEGRTILVKIPSSMIDTTVYDVNTGQFDREKLNRIFSGVASLTQDPGTGPMPANASIGVTIAPTGSRMIVDMAFPGNTAYGACPGYYSPLMVFFGKERPKFTANSSFPLFGRTGRVHWPEKNAPGAFLALDLDGDGKITSAQELFANSDAHKNGFEHLRQIDSNKDGMIDEKDKDFARLLLWTDKNADGESQPKELVKASLQVVSIDLNYHDKAFEPIGSQAELREASVFRFKNKAGRVQKGAVIDVWFQAIPGQASRAAASTEKK